jgi:hypothetical protein
MRPGYALGEDPRPVRGHGDRVLRVRGAAAVGGARPPHHPHPVRAPRAKWIAKRFIGTLRRERRPGAPDPRLRCADQGAAGGKVATCAATPQI